MEWRYICVRKERAEIPAHASNLAACDSSCRARTTSWLQGPGPGLEVLLCLGSVLLPHVDSNRYCRQGPKRQFASRKFKFKLAARPPAAPARPAGRRGRRCQSSDFECRGPGPGVAQFTEPESGRRRRRGCPAAPAVTVSVTPGPGPRRGRCRNRRDRASDRCGPNSGWPT